MMEILTKHIIKAMVIVTIAVWSSIGLELTAEVMATEKGSNSEFYNEKGYLIPKHDRPAIYPDIDPDRTCLFDTFQLKCIPGTEQECPEGFESGDPETCFAKTFINGKWEWECPEGYHSVDDDETGQCYPNSEGCPDHGLGYPTMTWSAASE